MIKSPLAPVDDPKSQLAYIFKIIISNPRQGMNHRKIKNVRSL